jgi:hypothetical protein
MRAMRSGCIMFFLCIFGKERQALSLKKISDWNVSCGDPKYLIMHQVYVDGRGIICQLSLNAAIVVVNMHLHF